MILYSLMLTFEEYLRSTAEKGGLINTLFEERLFALVGILERIAAPLAAEQVPYEVIGGMAVMVQVQRVDPSEVRLTKDIDIMIRRSDLERVKQVAESNGFTFGHAAGLYTLLPHGEVKAKNAIHLVFSGERTAATQAVLNPPIRPEYVSVHETEVAVIPVADLLAMKLSNNRDIDRVHIRDLDSVGLITLQIENALPPILLSRLQEIRSNP